MCQPFVHRFAGTLTCRWTSLCATTPPPPPHAPSSAWGARGGTRREGPRDEQAALLLSEMHFTKRLGCMCTHACCRPLPADSCRRRGVWCTSLLPGGRRRHTTRLRRCEKAGGLGGQPVHRHVRLLVCIVSGDVLGSCSSLSLCHTFPSPYRTPRRCTAGCGTRGALTCGSARPACCRTRLSRSAWMWLWSTRLRRWAGRTYKFVVEQMEMHYLRACTWQLSPHTAHETVSSCRQSCPIPCSLPAGARAQGVGAWPWSRQRQGALQRAGRRRQRAGRAGQRAAAAQRPGSGSCD